MNSTSKKVVIIVSIVFLAAIIAFEVFLSLAPKRKAKEIQNIVFSDSTYYNKYSDYLEFPELFPQIKEISFVEAQLDIAASDSICFVINAVEKTISLRFKAVDLHKTPITKMKVDPFFYSLDPITYRRIFSNTLKIRSDSSSIIKDPITVQKAPKDTIEAMALLAAPDSMKFGPAFITFNLDFGIKLVLKQTETDKQDDNEKVIRKQLDKDLYSERIKSNIFGLFKKDIQYVPVIEIEIPREDIHSFYRAIPKNGNIAFTF